MKVKRMIYRKIFKDSVDIYIIFNQKTYKSSTGCMNATPDLLYTFFWFQRL